MTNLLNGRHEYHGDISQKKNEFSGMIWWMNLRELDDGWIEEIWWNEGELDNGWTMGS